MKIEGIEKVFKRLSDIGDKVKGRQKPLKASAVHMVGSIKRNFTAQGRPEKWQALAPATVEARRKGKGGGSPKILLNTGILRNSISEKEVADGYAVGTNAVQARRQHFGYPPGGAGPIGKAGRGHSRTPARPFVMYQEEDIDAIETIFRRHIKAK